MSEPGETRADLRAQTGQWAMFIHLSTLAGWALPILGLILPVVLWQVKKHELPGIVPHAHVVMNWIISLVIYWCILMLLMIVSLMGMRMWFPWLWVGLGLFLLMALNLVYAIVGGIKANDGTLWPYPGTLYRFFK